MSFKVETKDKDFSRIPHALIDSGLLSQLKPSELSVFLVINRFADYDTGISYPTVKTIRELSGVSKNLIAKATEELVQKGLIEKKKTSKRFRFRNCYRVTRLKGVYSVLASSIIPEKTDKCKKIFRGKDGKFRSIPKKTDKGIPQKTDNPIPHITESDTYPQKTDKKENLEINIRDNVLDKTTEASAHSKSQASALVKKKSIKNADPEIIKQLLKKKGLGWTQDYFRKQGYPDEEIKSLKEEK